MKKFLLTSIFLISVSFANCKNHATLSEEWSQCIEDLEARVDGCLEKGSMDKKWICLKKFKKLSNFQKLTPKLKVKQDYLEFATPSGGCTESKDFLILIDRDEKSLSKTLTIYRVKMDSCERFLPGGTNVKFPYSSLGLQSQDQFLYENKTFRVP
ncbi:MAG: hypothetical protein CME64_00635 [Halobacteriovoraceae bacterium]|nr:hypothetical protein [Halobacteriovoraceae bacterium]